MNTVAIFLIKIYRIFWKPIMQGFKDSGVMVNKCIFTPSCSEYALDAFRRYRFKIALKKVINRLNRCRFGNEGGFDPP